ncbi:hypothetical protein [Sphingomonas beigongshangi]|nr:hypothetical protein [Sphingomonas beigongshangi]
MMKMLTMITAGAVALTGLAPIAAAPAAAQRTVVTERTVVRHDDGPRWHRGPHWRGRAHVRRVCDWQWRHHHRVRVCRTARW